MTKQSNIKKWMVKGFLVLILALLIIPQVIFAQNNGLGQEIETPFNVGEVIEKVSHHPIREGDRIVIKDRAYEAFFDEQGVILKPRQKKGKAEDLIIPIKGNPVIKDGKVIYHTEYGNIIFSGTGRGLNFEERWKSSDRLREHLITRYTGNVARLENEKANEYSRTGEFLIDTNVVYVPAPGWQSSPSVAFDGTNYLVVWYDSRSGSWDIYGARVSQSGTVLDPSGIPISTAANNQEYPSVAFDGTNYLVVWQDYRSGYYSDIYGARVSQSGTVLDPNGIPISTAANWQEEPSVAFDGTNYLVVWYDYRSGSWDIYGARVSQNGTVLDPSGIPISTAADDQEYPSVAFDGTNYLVVWHDYRSGPDIYGARVSQNGTVLDPNGIPISTAAYHQRYPSVAFDGTNYLVVWEDDRSGTSYDIYGARVSQNGTVLDPSGIPISTATNSQGYPSVAFDGTNYLVVWQDYRSGTSYDIYGARVSQSGTVLDPQGIPISTTANYQEFPSVAFGGTNYLVVWRDERRGLYIYNIYGARVSPSGTVLDPNGIPISTAAYGQYFPSVAFDGTNYLVVWEDERNGGSSDIYGARVSQNGTVLDPSGIPISTAADWQVEPSVAFDGTNYLVVWQDYRSGYSDIYGARVSQNGTVLDPQGIPISTAAYDQYSPSVAFDGTNYLVVWHDYRSGPDIYGARVSPSGLVIDSFPVSTQPDNQFSPAVAHGIGNQLLIVYSGFVDYINNHPANTMRIWGKFYPFTGIEEDFAIAKNRPIFLQIEPNPFYSSARITYHLASSCAVSLKIYNLTGQCVRTLIDAKQDVGIYEVNWSGKDDNQRELPQGIYFLQIKADGYTETKKMVLLH